MEKLPRLCSLIKGSLHLSEGPSPGCAHACRVALQDPNPGDSSYGVFIGNANRAYGVKVAMNPSGQTLEGKDDMVVPQAVEASKVPVNEMVFRSEVQSINLAEHADRLLLGGVDAYGTATMGWIAKDWHHEAGYPTLTHTLTAKPKFQPEAGWAGIGLDQSDWRKCAIARSYPRDVALFSDGCLERAFFFPHQPTDIKISQENSAYILVANGPEVWAIDPRMAENCGCVARMIAGHQGSKVFSVEWSRSSCPVIGAGTSERHLTIWEPRKWTQQCRWPNCLKDGITGVSFSKIAPNCCYITGLDPACRCGIWNRGPSSSSKRKWSIKEDAPHSFRGDARWLGVATCNSGDYLAGFSAAGSMFVASYSL